MPSNPRILISSSVYDKEELLEQIYATLTGIGYEVWMSFKGTIPVDPNLSAFDSCLKAVEECDLFLGIITGFYGSGIDSSEDSITHRELSKAIGMNKLRWFLVDQDVLVVRNFVKAINRFEQDQGVDVCSKLKLRQHDPISDMRVIEMYEEATRSELALSQRTGNWVQHFRSSHDVLKFIQFQLGNPEKYIQHQ